MKNNAVVKIFWLCYCCKHPPEQKAGKWIRQMDIITCTRRVGLQITDLV